MAVSEAADPSLALRQLASEVGLEQAHQEALRMAFGFACADRVGHLLEEPRAIEGLATLGAFVDGRIGRESLDATAQVLAGVATSHRGSQSLDGGAHAAVSATYALANALAGRALDAASYAAYASVYAYGGYAVSDPGAIAAEFSWQADRLRQLADKFDNNTTRR